MLFTSYEFILFAVVLFVLYYIIPKKFQWMLLLLASYVFYSFAGMGYMVYILATTLSTYFAGRRIGTLQTIQTDYLNTHKEALSREERKTYKARIKKKQRMYLVLCMVFNFGILAVLKYSGFTLLNVKSLLDFMNFKNNIPILRFALPLGISFYTFQTMGYIIDVYRDKYPYEKNIFKLALFISFFPQLIQGPISRFDDLKETLFGEHSFDAKAISFGLQRILWGFFKKLVIADRLLPAVNTIVRNPEEYQGVYVLVGMFFYAIQLYADFTGGIDIAIGVAEVFGIRLKENFERPYFSKSITEYWRRWHISLGSWFREYMFFPISVSKSMLNLSKSCRKLFGDAIGKRIPVYIATILVWFTTGVWHGAAWNFIVWGLLNCLVILVSQECIPLYQRFHKRFNVLHTFWYRLFQVARTFWLMSFLRTLDCYRDVGTTFRMYRTVFTRWNWNELFSGELLGLGLTMSDYIVLILAVLLVLYVSLASRSVGFREQLAVKPLTVRYLSYFALIIFILIFGAYGVGYDASQFIYSQF
ncbi:MAG TPA: MBOAT family protein [Clostridiales bacterium]|jgi:D-alanyl-lipoteichoic acid acyltransferase DltB (MBOAT superfamily)|nr:MBOAT family protein [Clostridiales bacterium]